MLLCTRGTAAIMSITGLAPQGWNSGTADVFQRNDVCTGDAQHQRTFGCVNVRSRRVVSANLDCVFRALRRSTHAVLLPAFFKPLMQG